MAGHATPAVFTICVVLGNVVTEDAEDFENEAGMPGGGLFGPRTVLFSASGSWATSLLLMDVSLATVVVSDAIAAVLT